MKKKIPKSELLREEPIHEFRRTKKQTIREELTKDWKDRLKEYLTSEQTTTNS